MIKKTLSYALTQLVLTASMAAHDTWLLPDPMRMSKPRAVTLSLTSGMEFPKLDHAIAADRIAVASWRSAKRTGILSGAKSGAHALEWRAQPNDHITLFSVTLHPRESKLKREQVREYLDHLGIPDAASVYAEWQRTSESEETAYRYVKYAKTFVRSGASGTAQEWATPAGIRLELVPQNDPTALSAGDTIAVVLRDDDKPLGRYPIFLIQEGAKEPIAAVTDANGRARITAPEAGRSMLRATVLERSADKAAKWDVHFTTMTFDVAAKRPRRR